MQWKAPLGLVAAELWATAAVYLVLGGWLLASAIMDERGTSVVGALGGAALFGALILGKWRPVLQKSVAHVESSEALSGVEIEPVRRTIIRAAARLAIVAVPLTYVVWAKVPSLGEAIMGGILLVASIAFGATSNRLRQLERSRKWWLVRETRRWAWSDEADHASNSWRRLKMMRRSVRESGWHWFAVSQP